MAVPHEWVTRILLRRDGPRKTHTPPTNFAHAAKLSMLAHDAPPWIGGLHHSGVDMLCLVVCRGSSDADCNENDETSDEEVVEDESDRKMIDDDPVDGTSVRMLACFSVN